MANPLMGMMGGAPSAGMNMGAIQQVKQMMNMFKSMKNPQQAIMQAAQNDPRLNSVMQMVGNGNPKDIFYQKCNEMGVNPEDILSQLR